MPRNWKWGKKRKSGFRSGLEESIAESLASRGIGFEYESLTLTYLKAVRTASCQDCGSKKIAVKRVYTPDFILGNGIIIEVKGRLTSQDRSKLIAVKESNPDRKLVLLFGADNKLSKISKTRYSEWATKYGFDYEIKTIPRRWLRGLERSS